MAEHPSPDAAGATDEPPLDIAAGRITNAMLTYVPEIVHDSGATVLFVYVDALGGADFDLPSDVAEKVFYVTKTPDEERRQEELHVRHLRVPNVALTRMGQVKMAVLLAIARGLVDRGDVIACLSGVAGSGTLDTIVVVEVGREFEMFCAPPVDGEPGFPVQPEILERVVEIATELGGEGREGRPLGALFVLGDTERVLSLSRQLILNPFSGYPEERRNVLDPLLRETVKELASIDGAFVIHPDGVVESAGTYLRTSSQDQDDLPKGLGARHHAAAGITAVSDAMAVVVSQSTGTVTVFRAGKMVTSIERPSPAR